MKAFIYNNFDYDKKAIHEYTIIEKRDYKSGNPVYSLMREGGEWTDPYKGTVALEVEDTGDGYKFSTAFKKEIGYDQAAEMYIMYKFLDIIGKQSKNGGGIYEGIIEIIKNSELQNI